MNENLKKKINSLVRNTSKNDLIKQCQEKNYDTSGSKYDLAIRILKIEKKEENKNIPNIILKIEKNKYGNYMHNDTNMVFDIHTKKVIGVQLPNGNVRTLNRNDIEICQKYKFQYNMPVLLDPSPIYEILENSDKENSDSEYSYDDDDIDEKNEEDIEDL
jgi:hypothetical protein